MGRHASICWGISLAAAIALVSLTGFSRFTGMAGIAFAIMLTTTAYGTLAPIMRARDLTNTSVGRAVTAYGATGEVLPVIAVALMLSTRSLLVTVIVLVVFMLVCVRIAYLSTSTARIGRFRTLCGRALVPPRRRRCAWWCSSLCFCFSLPRWLALTPCLAPCCWLQAARLLPGWQR